MHCTEKGVDSRQAESQLLLVPTASYSSFSDNNAGLFNLHWLIRCSPAKGIAKNIFHFMNLAIYGNTITI